MNPLILNDVDIRIKVHFSRLQIFSNDKGTVKLLHEFYPRTIDYDTIVIFSNFGFLTFEANKFLAKHGVSLLHTDYSGNLVSETIPADNAIHSKIRIAQFRVHENLDLRLQVASKIINDKNEACLHLLRSLGFEDLPQIPNAFSNFKELTNGEAEFSRFYWAKISEYVRSNTKFKEYHGRGNGEYQTNKNEKDVVNCALNLGYRLLEHACRLAVNSVGFISDVSFGIHESRPAKSPAIYDVMEHQRVTVDRKILDLLQSNKLTPKDFIYRRSDYIFRLNEKAEELVIRSVMDAINLNDIVLYTKSLARLCIDLAPESEPLTPIAKGSRRRHERDREKFSVE